MMNQKYRKKRRFTLVEIIVAMSIFALLMLLVMQIFGSMQNVWATTSSRTQTYQNARTIMDQITMDLQSAFYDAAADADSSWCYYQNCPNTGKFNENSRLWFVTHRQKSVQAQNSSLVQTGYWLESVSKDGVALFRLKNGVVSNIGTLKSLYTFRTSSTLPSGLTGTIDTNLSNAATVLDDNIVSLTIKPFVKLWNANQYNYKQAGSSGAPSYPLKKLPSYIHIELDILDDDPQMREQYKNAASDDDRKNLLRKFTRVIEIDRGQDYNGD